MLASTNNYGAAKHRQKAVKGLTILAEESDEELLSYRKFTLLRSRAVGVSEART